MLGLEGVLHKSIQRICLYSGEGRGYITRNQVVCPDTSVASEVCEFTDFPTGIDNVESFWFSSFLVHGKCVFKVQILTNTLTKHPGILNCLTGPLTHVWGSGMCRVSEQANAVFKPVIYRTQILYRTSNIFVCRCFCNNIQQKPFS